MSKKVNPYEKKNKKKLRITRNQWIIALSVLGVVAILVGISVMATSCIDPHAGHDHSTDSGEHYEGDGHDHGGSSNTTSSNAKVKYQIYTNEDGTYNVVFRDGAGKELKKVEKIAKIPMREEVNTDKGVYALSWATDSGPNDYMSVYFNEKTGKVSNVIHAPRGTDGVRVAYGSEDQRKIIVESLFDDQYRQEYTLPNAYTEADDIIIGGKLQVDNKTVVISYITDEKKTTSHLTVKLYE